MVKKIFKEILNATLIVAIMLMMATVVVALARELGYAEFLVEHAGTLLFISFIALMISGRILNKFFPDKTPELDNDKSKSPAPAQQ